jgi:hypothetical protein
MNTYIENLPTDTYQVQKWWRKDQLVMIISDLVIKKLTINIRQNKSVVTALKAKLSGQASKIFGEGSGFGIELKNEGNNTFSLSIATPVVISVLAARKASTRDLNSPKIQGDAAGLGWNDFVVAKIPVFHKK